MERLLYVERLRNHLGRKEAADDRKAHTLAERRPPMTERLIPWPKGGSMAERRLNLGRKRPPMTERLLLWPKGGEALAESSSRWPKAVKQTTYIE